MIAVTPPACTLTTSLDGFSEGRARPDAGGAVDAGGHEGTDGASASLPRACKDLTTATPAMPDGYYRIDPDGSGPLRDVEVYCDMTTAGGGWTLIARSSGANSVTFGWNVTTGGVKADDKPYSLGVTDTGLAFSEILVGVRGAGKALGSDAYKMTVGDSFNTKQATSAIETLPVTVLGTCRPPNGPIMFRFVGFTSKTELFFFRDKGIEKDDIGGSYGLASDGFQTLYDDCPSGGNTVGKHGEIFVR